MQRLRCKARFSRSTCKSCFHRSLRVESLKTDQPYARPHTKHAVIAATWQQCGGEANCGEINCPDAIWTHVHCPVGSTCVRGNKFFWQCVPSQVDIEEVAKFASLEEEPGVIAAASKYLGHHLWPVNTSTVMNDLLPQWCSI